jgi:hypothetical protein
MPQLGAINYSPILQGSLAAAEGQMRGSEAVARGIQALGQQAAAGIEKYYDRKEANELFSGTTERVKEILKKNPAFASRFGVKDPEDTKAVQAGLLAMGGGDKRTASKVTEQLLFQLGTEQETMRREEAGRRAISDALDPVMALANRQITPDQFTAGQGIGANQFLMSALAGGAPVEAATRIAGQIAEREALQARIQAERDIAAGKLAAEQARAAAEAGFKPSNVVMPDGTVLIETSRGKFEVQKPNEKGEIDLEIPIPGVGIKRVRARQIGTRLVDAKSGIDIYTRPDQFGQPAPMGLNPDFASQFNAGGAPQPEPEKPKPGVIPPGWSPQK